MTINLSTQISGSNGPTSFWLHANKYGVTPIDRFYASGQWGVYKIYHPHNPRLLQFSGGVELITNFSEQKKTDFFFTDLFVAAKLGTLELLLGQRKNLVSLVDSTLGSGSLAMSGNARPIPQIQLAITEFEPVSFLGDVIAYKLSVSDGVLGESQINYGAVRKIPRAYFHQKQLYFRLGQSRRSFKAYLGINHQAIWGGENQINPVDSRSTLKSYWKVLTGKSENSRKIGMHFGTIDLAVDAEIASWKFFIYRNNIYDSGSMFQVKNISDGLNGIKIIPNKHRNIRTSRFQISAINFEYLSLQNQKNYFNGSQPNVYAVADYYNNYIYKRGWSFYGNTIGSALVPSKNITKTDLPMEPTQFTNNNRVQAIHGAVQGSLFGIALTLKTTYSKNNGAYLTPFKSTVNQWSFLVEGGKRISLLHGAVVTAGIACDVGKLYPNSQSIYLGLKKVAFLN